MSWIITDETHDILVDRIDNNDRSITGLVLGTNDVNYARLGPAIARNSHIQHLEVHLLRNDELPDQEFFDGLKCNSSIKKLTLNSGDFCHGLGQKHILTAFAGKRNLKQIALNQCHRGNGGLREVANCIKHCNNLIAVSIQWSRLGTAGLSLIIEAVRELPKLGALFLVHNNIDDIACEVLATLLKDPGTCLLALNLFGNDIGDEGVAILARALEGNTTLTCLVLNGNRRITFRGWNAFSNVLCNTSSINGICKSNHTLNDFGVKAGALPNHIWSSIVLNNGADKKQVATKKILWKHPHFDMEPFFEWGMRMLPVFLCWLDRNRAFARNYDTNVLSAIYQFIRATPDAAVQPNNLKTKAKRKRVD